MIEIIMSVCLMGDIKKIDNDLSCIRPRDVTLTFISEQVVTPQQCILQGQSEIAKWFEEHPNYKIMRWKCLNTDGKKRLKA